jgi:hypothetical protein
MGGLFTPTLCSQPVPPLQILIALILLHYLELEAFEWTSPK